MVRNPPNPNQKLKNNHTLYLAITGGGKSQVLKQKSGIPASGARVVLFDPSRDHKKGTKYYSDRVEFARALKRANASGKGFRIGYDGRRSVEVHEWWCACVYAILDGRKLTYAITEELGRVSLGSTKTTEYHELLLNEGRKYGLIYHCTTQFASRISKDVYDNAGVIFFGKLSPRLIRKIADDYGLEKEELKALQNLEFIRWDGSISQKIKIPYKK